ncbi:MdtP family multidrug efflux transporter outer membrane subunit [Tatumella ptyseos]|uniref:MdtP family multidrug efflux transporter outer membrane subunit n=1 Tax=Tatumella ptyseos TaxID=82987 RepID=UPI0026F1176E|nr:MdtP family multidrug efflux transporter outer membrane subunit [Tatumella ptyseos]WKX26900.1 MdtP family multidrug efflux transporter outer membrane subunit [Tatumella ptyseos]
MALKKRFSLACIMLLLNGCALIHDEPPQVDQLPAQQAQLSQVIHLANSGWPQARWWEAYHDQQLSSLIVLGLANSPTFQAAKLRIQQSQSSVEVAQSTLGIQATGIAAQNTMRVTDRQTTWPYSISLPTDKRGPWYTLSTVGVGADLNIDLWGANRAGVAAAMGEQNAQLAQTAAIQLDLASSIAQLYFSLQANYRREALLVQQQAIAEFSLKAHQQRAARGIEDQVNIAAAQSEWYSAQQQHIAVQTAIMRDRENLRALTGMNAQQALVIAPQPWPQLQQSLPASLSFDLLACRPDLQAMSHTVQASLSRVEAAKAAFYPHLDIKAFWGYNALSIGDLFKSSFQQFNILPGLYLPLFDGGRLNAALRSTRTASNILIKQYNQAVLDAVRDVAITSQQLNDLNQQVLLQQQKVAAAQLTTDSVQAHYQRGLTSLYMAQEAKRATLTQQLLLVDLNAQQLSCDLLLIKALGGGYRAEQPAILGMGSKP